MPKLQNPPQGGEKYLCLTLFLTMLLSVWAAVAIIYSIVIIYLPSKVVLESNITGKTIFFNGSLILIKMDQEAWMPKNTTQKLPQIVLEESIGVGMLISIGYYI